MAASAFVFHEPGSLAEACSLLERHGARAVLLAGGTDLVVALKQRRVAPGHVIHLGRVPGLDQIRPSDGGLHLGALVTLDRLAAHPEVQRAYPALAQAAAAVGSPLQRNAGTLGGNLCVDTRCRYINQSEFWRDAHGPCYKAGGTRCHVTSKDGHCSAAFSGDVAPALLALDAQVVLAGPGLERRIPLAGFYTGDGKYPTLASREPAVLAAVEIPGARAGGAGFYRKFRYRGSIEFPLVGVAVWLRREGNTCTAASLYATGVGMAPVQLREAAAVLTGGQVDIARLLAVAAAASKEVQPVKTTTVGPAYRRKMLGLILAESLAQEFGLPADALAEVAEA